MLYRAWARDRIPTNQHSHMSICHVGVVWIAGRCRYLSSAHHTTCTHPPTHDSAAMNAFPCDYYGEALRRSGNCFSITFCMHSHSWWQLFITTVGKCGRKRAIEIAGWSFGGHPPTNAPRHSVKAALLESLQGGSCPAYSRSPWGAPTAATRPPQARGLATGVATHV